MIQTEKYKLYNGDCLDVMQKLSEENIKVDLILTDPPYNTTGFKWDSMIPLDEMWVLLKQLRKTDKVKTTSLS